MAIDKNQTELLLRNINSTFDNVTVNLEPNLKDWLKEQIMGPAIEEIEELVTQSRPPKFFLFGRSGHGKSSVINALSGKEQAEVGHEKPTTPKSIKYSIRFEETKSE